MFQNEGKYLRSKFYNDSDFLVVCHFWNEQRIFLLRSFDHNYRYKSKGNA